MFYAVGYGGIIGYQGLPHTRAATEDNAATDTVIWSHLPISRAQADELLAEGRFGSVEPSETWLERSGEGWQCDPNQYPNQRVILMAGTPEALLRAHGRAVAGWAARPFRDCILPLRPPAACHLCGDYTPFRGEYVCIGCATDDAGECEGCGRLVWDDLPNGWEAVPIVGFEQATGLRYRERIGTEDGCYLCEDCVYYCASCELAYGSEDGALECCGGPCGCEDCEECCDSDGGLHSYDYRPAPRFAFRSEDGSIVRTWAAPRGQLFVGIELEAEDVAHLVADFQARTGQDYGSEDFHYWKRDGSLGRGGAELVTHPATLEAFRELFPWDALAWANAEGARAYRRPSCGMHLHLSRSAFVEPSHLARFVRLHTRNRALFEAVGQRTGSNWAVWPDGPRIGGQDLPKLVKGQARPSERYLAINFLPAHTIELRFAKGNLAKAAILRKVELADAAFRYTLPLTVPQVVGGALDSRAFCDWIIANQVRYPELGEWTTRYVATDPKLSASDYFRIFEGV